MNKFLRYLQGFGFLLGFSASLHAQTIIYVKSGGTGDGSSWSSPLGNIQAAITTAAAGDQVWVAKGSYYSNYANDFVFNLKDGVKIYGGFSGTETTINARNWKSNATILLGTYNSNKEYATVNAINLTSATVLDGFTIQPPAQGAIGRGMYNNNSSTIISNCTFNNNVTQTTNPTPDGLYNGGAMYNVNSNPVIDSCTFSGNSAQGTNYGGGAIYNNNSSPTITACTFSGNKAYSGGGAIYNNTSSNAIISNCMFTGNIASALNTGGYGGAVCNINSSPSIINCLIIRDTSSAFSGGGAIYNYAGAPTITNCTISGNASTGSETGGGAICYAGGSQGSINNCIIWTNTAIHADPQFNQEIVLQGGSTLNVTNSLIRDGLYSSMNQSPQFIDSANGNYKLNPASPAIDAGDNSVLSTTDTLDLADNDRVIDGTVDMGAYEATVINKIVNNGDSSYNGMSGSLNITGTSYGNGEANTYKWKVKTILGSAADSLEINPADFASYQSVMQPLGITLDSIEFSMTDLSKLPTFMSIVSPGSQDYWNSFVGDIYLSRIVNPADNATDSSISNTIVLHIASALPVAVNGFSGKLQNGTAALQWQTGVESNINHFEIEKSTDGKTFSSIGSVQPKGSGNSYSFNASQPEPVAYYQLKRVDNDGFSSVYPKIVVLSQTVNEDVAAYPNPAIDHINIKVANAAALTIYDAVGRIIKTQALKAGVNTIDIHSLPTGIYFIQTGTKKLKIIKE
ncbi:MAG: T9SS type A sorting domain-containing protein [Arachidicoccus sp.]|nr:T9SS type A sorting domain-containing protein [Arachidicoccus sp.]